MTIVLRLSSLRTLQATTMELGVDRRTTALYVRSALEHFGATQVPLGEPNVHFILGYMGDTPVVAANLVATTLIAPRAGVELGAVAGSSYTGTLFGRRITVRPLTEIEFVPLRR